MWHNQNSNLQRIFALFVPAITILVYMYKYKPTDLRQTLCILRVGCILVAMPSRNGPEAKESLAVLCFWEKPSMLETPTNINYVA